MNRPRPHTPTRTPRGGMSLHAGRLQSGWCPACKAYTYVSCALLLLTEQGVATIGELGWCEICDDPDDPLPPRRIDRAGS